MKRFTSPKYLVILLIVIIFISAGVWFSTLHPISKTYVGSKAVLTTPSQNVRFQIDDAVLSLPPRIPQGIQADMRITAYTTPAARGYVTFSKTYAPVQFIVAKSGNSWVVIAHTTKKSLTLPNITIAKKYNLPVGWYSNN